MQSLGAVSKLGSDTFSVAKEVRAINFTAGTERHCQISDILELGTRRVKYHLNANDCDCDLSLRHKVNALLHTSLRSLLFPSNIRSACFKESRLMENSYSFVGKV